MAKFRPAWLTDVRVPRVYASQLLKPLKNYHFEPQQAHYISHVLRLKPNAKITLFDGSGYEFTAQLTLQKKQLSADILSSHAITTESPLNSLLVQGISRGERMDFTLQKATELGVSAILPIFTQRSVVQLDNKRLEKKQAHWAGVMQSAAEQSGRSKLPILHPIIKFKSWLDSYSSTDTDGILLSPTAGLSLGKIQIRNKACVLLVGPEGGLTDIEIQQSIDAGFTAVTLGPRILRTETAPLVALSLLQNNYGDLDSSPKEY